MANAFNHLGAPRLDGHPVSLGNTGPNNAEDIFEAGPNGSLIHQIRVTSHGISEGGVVTIYVAGFYWTHVEIPVSEPGNPKPFSQVLEPSGGIPLPGVPFKQKLTASGFSGAGVVDVVATGYDY